MVEQTFVEMVDRFKKIGLPETVSRTLAILADNQWHKLRNIERLSDLRQPEVSIAVNKHLKKFIVVKEVQNQNPSKHGPKKPGRPEKHVRMTEDMYQSLISTLQGAENKRHKQVLGAIDSVRVVPKR